MTEPDRAQASSSIERLEMLVGDCIRLLARYRQDNAQLRDEVRTLRQERESLSRKNRQVAARVDLLIERLKAMEHES